MSSAPVANLFAGLLGPAWKELPAPVRALHDRALPARFCGEVEIDPARGRLARLLARGVGLPMRAGSHPLVVEISGDSRCQQWIRHFPPHPLRSRLTANNGLLCERMGPVGFRFRLLGDADGLVWQLVAARALGVPLPLAWFGGVRAREFCTGKRYRFDVSASLPLAGHLVGYRGWLDVG